SMTDYSQSIPVVVGVTALFIIGGLGWGVLLDMNGARQGRRLGLHSRLMLVGTAVLLVVGTLGVAIMEWQNPATLGGMSSAWERIGGAWFQAATPRTAGFSTVDIGGLQDETSLFMMLLMFIGAGAASTGGGIKVTTAVVMVLAAVAFYRRRDEIHVFSRTLGFKTVMKVLAVAVSAGALVLTGTFALAAVSEAPFLDLAFEAVSAFGTVGLSRGVTSDLGVAGQTVLIVLMFSGRVLPLTLGYFLLVTRRRKVDYPRGEIFLG
ncbi:MAG: potassium transporter TrkG, partial [Pacificimonas sp.]